MIKAWWRIRTHSGGEIRKTSPQLPEVLLTGIRTTWKSQNPKCKPNRSHLPKTAARSTLASTITPVSTPGEKAVADTDRASDRRSRVFLLGRFEVWLGDTIVIDRSWSRRKARTLLKLLAVQPGRTMHRDRVQEWLRPELDGTAAANNRPKSLHFLC